MINSLNINNVIDNVQNACVDKLKNNTQVNTKEGLKKTAEDFESVFLTKMFDIMESTVEKSDFVNGGKNEQMFKSFMHQEVAKSIASNPATSIGIAKQMYDQMKNLV